MGLLSSVFGLSLFAALAAILVPWGSHLIRIGGPFLTPNPTVLAEGHGPIFIEDTIHCEDVHHYRPANLLFAACEDSKSTRFDWFPPLGHLTPQPEARGSIHVVNPKTLKSSRLEFENFEGSFVTHGIDVIEDPKQADAVYIFAVNHLPNPDHWLEGAQDTPKARSQIELFHHVLKSKTIQHVRSIQHPLIETPNDVYADSPNSVYITNDHFYREGPMRLVEDLWPSAKWSTVVHVQITDLKAKDSAGLDASVAHSGLWNNNGLGHGRTDDEIVISSAIGGELYVSKRHANNTISIKSTIPFDTVTDNPSYYADPYRTDAHDASGYVVAGVSQGIYLAKTARDPDATDPCQVWYARPTAGGWEKKLLFEDDGSRIRSASAAVLVPIEPKMGQKKAWLFVTGFLSEKMIAVKVDL
ncbi:uncharacterized protein N7498_007486 [Penicillium cinerascens]|uniref:Serum paraoxonase/arylesterase family protein n=1 Tax=Penicillium cinerascens TaxID=70096 RepID=A0A9W9ME11_9EURO|nr:uncharacterized protein N7498_007486 [Penicillium cinerascens]KAJ5198369.1 hypothetical protein N7498_007486 [Penicillium cinerascens]